MWVFFFFFLRFFSPYGTVLGWFLVLHLLSFSTFRRHTHPFSLSKARSPFFVPLPPFFSFSVRFPCTDGVVGARWHALSLSLSPSLTYTLLLAEWFCLRRVFGMVGLNTLACSYTYIPCLYHSFAYKPPGGGGGGAGLYGPSIHDYLTLPFQNGAFDNARFQPSFHSLIYSLFFIHLFLLFFSYHSFIHSLTLFFPFPSYPTI